MRDKIKTGLRLFLVLSFAFIVSFAGCVGFEGSPALDDMYTLNIYPAEDNTYQIGSQDLLWSEGWFNKIFVGNPASEAIVALADGGILAEGAIRAEKAVTAVTYDGGTGIWVTNYGDLLPLHTGVGSFDYTGGAYENLFTSNANVFQAEDAELRNFIIILEDPNYGKAAEIVTFIDTQNVVVQPWGWSADFSNMDFAIFPHPLFGVGYGGHISMQAQSMGNVEVDSYNYESGDLFTVCLDANLDDLAAILSEVDAEGFESVAAIIADYNTGALQPSDHAHILLIVVDESEALASDATTELDFIELLTTDANALEKHAIHVGQGFDSALTVSGGTREDPDDGYEVTAANVPTDRVNGVAPDGTAFLNSSASDLIIFDDDNDYILIGSDATFETIEVILDSGANQPIRPDYYYSSGVGTWTALTVSDTTNGFTQSGVITFEAPAGWVKTNAVVPAGAAINNAYYVKIVRTRNNLGAPPVEDYFKTYPTGSITGFEIRGDGTIRPVEMADAAAPNNSLYFSTTQNKLVYKDNGGVVHDLW